MVTVCFICKKNTGRQVRCIFCGKYFCPPTMIEAPYADERMEWLLFCSGMVELANRNETMATPLDWQAYVCVRIHCRY